MKKSNLILLVTIICILLTIIALTIKPKIINYHIDLPETTNQTIQEDQLQYQLKDI